ncbi:MAG: tetratricopeptide repeat protein [Treponema sp.]|jgi:tetratricopeptide (TPR) repeat protein|nr:tetratricopeptide repeat protein [Treponema sp.]
MQNEKEQIKISEKINDFFQKNRKGALVSLGAIIILFVGFIVFISMQDFFRKKAINEVEELNSKFENIRYSLNDEEFFNDIETLLDELNNFAKSKSGFAGSKAWTLIAQIHGGREDWQKAQEAWLNAAKTGDKTYLAPISLFNAAAAAEEQGNLSEAIELLQKCIAHRFEFPAAPRAQFSIGRLYEELGNYPAAIEAYRSVLIDWQDVPVWQHLARSRMTSIEVGR